MLLRISFMGLGLRLMSLESSRKNMKNKSYLCKQIVSRENWDIWHFSWPVIKSANSNKSIDKIFTLFTLSEVDHFV